MKLRHASIALTLPLVANAVAACGASGTTAPPARSASATAAPPAAKDAPLRHKLDQFAPAKLTADVSRLPPPERAALEKLIAAAKLLDPVFDRQAYAENPDVRARLVRGGAASRDSLAYFDLMRGPWDRQDHFAPFAIDRARPPGAGFYPEDATADEIRAWIAAHPQDKAAFESLTTVIVRTPDHGLKAVPYGQAYEEWLQPASQLLVDASKLTENKSLATFLRSRAAAFLSDDYYASDKDWMDLDSLVEITIGPYETYEDDLLGLKGSFEAFVTVSDPAASAKLAKYKQLLPDMEANLPVPAEVHAKRGAESPIRVVDVVFTSGDARKSVQTIAFNLPNDERVRAEKGAKKVMLRNLIETKFEMLMRPIAERLLAPSQLPYLSSEAFFDETLFHELSHSLGPAFVHNDGKNEVRKALGASYSAIEECKADVMGAYNILYLTKRGEMPKEFREKLMTSYFAGLFRSTRFGVAEAHGQGAAVQINRYVEEGAATLDPKTGRFTVDFPKLEASITKLVHDLCMLQHEGDKGAVEALLAKYGRVSDAIARANAQLDGIPVDVRPIYPLAGE